MNSRLTFSSNAILVCTVSLCCVLVQPAAAFQTGPMVPIRKDRTIDSSWRSLNGDRDHFPVEQDHSPLPPPLSTNSNSSNNSNLRFENSSFGKSPQDYEEVQGFPVSEDDRDLQETSGRVEVIYERYEDGKVQIKRHVMQDEFGNYLRHGIWQLYNRRGQTLAEGKYERGLMQGGWKRWHPKSTNGIFRYAPFTDFQGPFLSQATFYEGKLDGVWEIFDQYRRKIFEMPYTKGNRNGTAVWYRLNGTKLREMSFRDGLPHGELIEWDQRNKISRQDEFIEGHKVTEQITYWRPKQPKTEDHYLEPKLVVSDSDDWWNASHADYRAVGQTVRHGISAAWYDNGQPKMRGQYKTGSRFGRFTWWHRNGQVDHTGKYVDGMKNGKWTWWHENGMKAHEGEYQDDAPIGEWTSWNPDGTVKDSGTAGELPPIDSHEELPTYIQGPANTGELQSPITGIEEIEGIAAPSNSGQLP